MALAAPTGDTRIDTLLEIWSQLWTDWLPNAGLFLASGAACLVALFGVAFAVVFFEANYQLPAAQRKNTQSLLVILGLLLGLSLVWHAVRAGVVDAQYSMFWSGAIPVAMAQRRLLRQQPVNQQT